MDNIIFDFSEDVDKTVDNTKQLAQLTDDIKEIINFPNYNTYDDAIVNRHCIGVDFGH